LRDLSEAVRLDPAAPRPVELLGDVNAAMGRHERAAELYLTFTQLDDRSQRVLYKLGLAHYRTGQVEAAIAPLTSAVAIDSRLAEAHYLLGMCETARGNEREALRSLERALEIDAAFVPAREELADLHARAGRQRESIEQLEALAALEPARPERLIAVGLAHAGWGRTDTAVLALGRAAERFSDHSGVYTALGRVWLMAAEQRNDRVALGKAIEALEPAAGAAGASADTLTLFGRAILLSGNVTRAESILAEATSRLPVDPLAFRYLADAAERAGHAATARDALRRYVALVRADALDPAIADRLAGLAG
jgi:tetratricopeptide (TPR) repeat protein